MLHELLYVLISYVPVVAREATTSEEPNRCSREVPQEEQEQRNMRESMPTQYLTKFDNLPTSSCKGESDFIDSTINYNLFLTLRNFQKDFQWHTIHEGSNPYL